MAKELLSARTYHRYYHPNYPFNTSFPCSSLELTAHASGHHPLPAPASMTLDDRRMRVHIIVTHNNMVLTPTSNGRTVLEPETNGPPGSVVYDFHVHCPNPRSYEFVGFVSNMLPLLNICPNACHHLMVHMPTFFADAEAKAWHQGFSLLEIKAHINEIVDVKKNYIFDYSVDQLVDATMGAGAMEVVKGEAGKVCPVCLDEFMEGVHVSKLKLCSHAFHTMCIGRWLQQSLRNGQHGLRCPICRLTIVNI